MNLPVVHPHDLDLPLAQERNRFLPVDDLKRFVRRIQKQRLFHRSLGLTARSCLNFARRFTEVSRLGRRKRLENWRLAALSAKRTTVDRGPKPRWLRPSAIVATAAIASA